MRGALCAREAMFSGSASENQARAISARVTLSQSTQRVNKKELLFYFALLARELGSHLFL